MHRFFQVGYAIFFVLILLMLLVLPWPNGTAMYPFLILVICAWGFWYSGKKHRRKPDPKALPSARPYAGSKGNAKSNAKSKPNSKSRR